MSNSVKIIPVKKWEAKRRADVESGTQAERERIIKLIQEELGAWGDVNVGSVIALIKGNNK